MAGKLNTLPARLILVALLVHAVLLPVLFFAMIVIVEESHNETFVNQVRIYSRFLADMLETTEVIDSDEEVTAWLDSAILGGDGVYAELIDGDRRLLSSFMESESPAKFNEDFRFGTHGDDVYFLSIPLNLPNHDAILKLGFDELPTLEQIIHARTRALVVLAAYLIVSIVLLLVLSILLMRPLKVLRLESKAIASGEYRTHLKVDSSVSEFHDLATDLDLMRHKLVSVNEQLSREIGDRKAAEKEQAALETQLRHAQRLETIGTLAGGIAHEFNNILLPILLYVELTLDDLPSDSPVRNNLVRVMDSANRAKSLVQQILTFSRQAGTEKLTPTRIVSVVNETLSMLRALLPATVELERDVRDDASYVSIEVTQVQQLVMNLCNNAYQAMQTTGGRLTVQVANAEVDESFAKDHPRLKPGPYVKLTVSDTGEGIDSKTMQRIFEPFFSTRGVGEGTGLGLSVVHGITVGHGGDIIVESQPGLGSTFTVLLPAISEEASEQA